MTSVELEKDIENFKINQQKQKQRGLNNYNVMTAIRKPHSEVGMHSNFLYSLLDINGKHYQSSLFAELFIKNVLNIDDFGKIQDVSMEEQTATGRRIDFTIKSENYYIGIEMKIYANDQNRQIIDYYEDLKKKANKQVVKIYYLTLTGVNPNSKSLANLEKKYYENISFQKEILLWLKTSKKQVSNITNLNNAIEYYMNVVRELLGQYKSPIMDYKDFFMKSQIRYKAFDKYKYSIKNLNNYDEINYSFSEAKQELLNTFYEELFHEVLENEKLFFKKYDKNESYQLIRFTFHTYYDISIYLNKEHNKLISIGIRLSDEYTEQTIKQSLNKFKKIDNNNYIIGKSKGVKIDSTCLLPKPTIDNLFTKIEMELNKNLVFELNKHIYLLEKIIKNN